VNWSENEMASDEHVATALRAFAKALLQGSRVSGALSEEQEAVRRKHLEGLSKSAQVLAVNPRAATYLGFERIWKEARELGVEVPSEITMAVASAFMQRPHIRARIE
jgi:hypothetical protein